jgi:hypothetical protein
MRDPHVASLRYRFVAGGTVSFDCPPPVERETEAFRMRLGEGVATFEMIEHHASEDTAMECVETYLHRWEIEAALRPGAGRVSFEFEGADVVDRDAPPPGSGQVIYAKAAIAAASALTATLRVTRRQYPDPPDKFVVSADVETMWWHYEQFREGRERLVDMANFCLTVLEESAGGRNRARDRAAEKYSIEIDVLHTLGRLTSSVGDKETARKAKGLSERRQHTGAEKAWIEAAIKLLTLRAGEWAFDPGASLPRITMSDSHLPKL